MQKERLRLCPSCSGWRLIHSRAVGARKKPMHIAAVLIPQDACNQCLNLAYDQYEKEKKAGTFDWVYLQDVLSLYKPEE